MTVHGVSRKKAHGPARLVAMMRGFHDDDSGAVLFIGFFGAVALVFLLAMVLNVAANISEKERMQNASDAAALAAAHEVANGLNTISDCNVAITEYLAIYSVSKGLYQTGSNEAIQKSYEFQYYAYRKAYLLAVEVPPLAFALWVAMQEARVAYNYCMQVERAGGILNETTPQGCDTAIRMLDGATQIVAASTALNAFNVSKEVATAPENGGAKYGGVVIRPVLPIERREKQWAGPTMFGSPRDKANPAKSASRDSSKEMNRRGYFHVYYGKQLYPNYDLDIGPFPKLFEDCRQWVPIPFLGELVNPWNLPVFDPGAFQTKVDSLENEYGDEDSNKALEERIKSGSFSLDGFLSGVTRSLNANGRFREYSENHLLRRLRSMGSAFSLNKDFATAYNRLSFVGYAIGGSSSDDEPKPIAFSRGEDDSYRPFAMTEAGFRQPQQLGTVAVAQAQVYNPVSWDLFTQYWDYKLTRVTQIPNFVGAFPIGTTPGKLYH